MCVRSLIGYLKSEMRVVGFYKMRDFEIYIRLIYIESII